MRTITFINARTPLTRIRDEFARTGASVLVVLADDRSPIGAITTSQLAEIQKRFGNDLHDHTAAEAVKRPGQLDDEALPPVLAIHSATTS
jgi:hypothetical protein